MNLWDIYIWIRITFMASEAILIQETLAYGIEKAY